MAGRRCRHGLETDAASRQREHELSRREDRFPAGAEEDRFEPALEELGEVAFDEMFDVRRRPLANLAVDRQQDVVTDDFIADSELPRFDMSHRDGKIPVSGDLHLNRLGFRIMIQSSGCSSTRNMKNGGDPPEPYLNDTRLEAAIEMPHAVVALPASWTSRRADASERRWLSRSRLRYDDAGDELLPRILAALHLAPPGSGLGALRMWGQTGERPTVWVAAADPVYLEARLDHVCLFALGGSELPVTDVRAIFDTVQAALGSNGSVGSYAFARIGALGYLRSDHAITTAAVSPRAVHGASPDIYLPEGEQAQAHDRLQSEVQMCLHESDINRQRGRVGMRPVNSLWFWGGGMAPPQVIRDVPPLFSDDPLMRGYWQSSTGTVLSWPGSLEACVDAAQGGFVAVVPGTGDRPPMTDADAMSDLGRLRHMLSNGRLQSLTLLFQDGLRAEFRRTDRFRFWRRGSPLLPETKRP